MIAMESFLSLFIFHDSYIVSSLVFAITVIVVLLLLFNHKSPDAVVKSEMGGSDAVEGALRRVLGEQRWNQASSSSGDLSKLVDLEKEILVKDKAIAELNKQITYSGGGSDSDDEKGDNSELLKKINDLESRLQEYEIIEDDIADLSLYRSENEKLKIELSQLKNQLGVRGDVAPQASGEVETLHENADSENEEEDDEELKTFQQAASLPKEGKVVDGMDLVAEFEKVVNNQDQLNVGQEQVAKESSSDGKIKVTELNDSGSGEIKVDVHPKLKNVSPDSKEEAEVFIADLKSLKKEKK